MCTLCCCANGCPVTYTVHQWTLSSGCREYYGCSFLLVFGVYPRRTFFCALLFWGNHIRIRKKRVENIVLLFELFENMEEGGGRGGGGGEGG